MASVAQFRPTQPMVEPAAVPAYALFAFGLCITVMLMTAMGFTIAPELLLPLWMWPFVAVSAMLLRRVGHSRIASGLEGTALFYGQGIGFLYMLLPLSALSLPFGDPWLSRADRLLGFDWAGYAAAMKPLSLPLKLAYRSIAWQPALVIIALCASGLERRMWKLVLASAIVLAIAVAIFPFTPAVGPQVFYGLVHGHQTPLGFGEVIQILKDGQRVVSRDLFTGFISFPSCHAAAALLFIWAAWPIRALRCPVAALNLVMLAVTPILGNHYLVDVLAGLFLAIVSIELASRISRRGHSKAGVGGIASNANSQSWLF